MRINNELSSMFEDPEFKSILAKYEGMVENHTPVYFDADELNDLADYYIYIGKEDEADQVVDYSLQLHPTDTDSLIFKARSLSYKGKREEAYKVMQLIEDPSDREVQFLKAEFFTEEGRHKEAEEVYQELAEAEEESMEVLTDIALCYLDNNNQEYTEKWIEKIRSKGFNEENNQRFRDLWCDYCMTFGYPENAEKAFHNTLDHSPYSIRHWNGLAKCYLAQNKVEQAHECVDFSLAIDENNQEALELKGFCYMQGENYESAIEMCQKAMASTTQKGRIYALLAQCYNDSGRIEEGLDCYKQWLKDCPQLTNYEKMEIYSLIATSYCNLQQPAEGMKYIDAALDLDPLFYGAIIQKGTLHYQLGEEEEGKQLFEKALSLAPNDEKVDVMYGIANSYFFLKHPFDVIHWCNRIINEYPIDELNALILAAFCHCELNDMPACLSCFMKLGKYKEELKEDSRTNTLFKELISKLKQNLNDNIFNIDN